MNKWKRIRSLTKAILLATVLLITGTVWLLAIKPSAIMLGSLLVQLVCGAVQCQILRVSRQYVR